MYIGININGYKKAKKQKAGQSVPLVCKDDYILAKSMGEIKRLLIQQGKHLDDHVIFDLFENKGEENYVEI